MVAGWLCSALRLLCLAALLQRLHMLPCCAVHYLSSICSSLLCYRCRSLLSFVQLTRCPYTPVRRLCGSSASSCLPWLAQDLSCFSPWTTPVSECPWPGCHAGILGILPSHYWLSPRMRHLLPALLQKSVPPLFCASSMHQVFQFHGFLPDISHH